MKILIYVFYGYTKSPILGFEPTLVKPISSNSTTVPPTNVYNYQPLSNLHQSPIQSLIKNINLQLQLTGMGIDDIIPSMSSVCVRLATIVVILDVGYRPLGTNFHIAEEFCICPEEAQPAVWISVNFQIAS